jgi:hypothetical protein
VAKVANTGVAARQRARERQAAVWAARSERDRRIQDAVTAGLAAADERVTVDRRRDLAVEAARLAMAEAERVANYQRAAADGRVAAAMVALRAEGVAVRRIADLLGLAVTDVRRALRRAAVAGDAVAGDAKAGDDAMALPADVDGTALKSGEGGGE